MTKSRKSAGGKRKGAVQSVPAPAPVVRIPGLNTEELALIDRAAQLDRRSRADWCRIQLLGVAAERADRSRVAPMETPRVIRTPADAAEAVARKTGVQIRTFDPDA